MIKEIERPEWPKMIGISTSLLGRSSRYAITCFDSWFDLYIEPINKLIREGEVLYWTQGYNVWCEKDGVTVPSRRGLLIGEEPIKKETAEDVLRKWLAWLEGGKALEAGSNLVEEAKKVLGE